MKDNLSIVITVIVLVLLMVIFPLYNFFERQDDMSYNLVLKATTNFADQVMNNGYIDQNTYDKFVTELGNTGNIYDIQIEAHRKVLTVDKSGTDVYTEQSYIDYTDDIFESITNTTDSNLMKKSLKNNIYLLNPKDEIYVKVKNSNTTMAGALFNAIIPASKKTRIEVNYGGIIKNNAWKDVDATFTGHNLAPGAPTIYLKNSAGTDVKTISNNEEEYYKIAENDLVDNGYKIYAESTAFEERSISKYVWKITDVDDLSKVNEYNSSNNYLQGMVWEENKKYSIEVYSVDSAGYKSDTTKVNVEIANKTSGTPETDSIGDLSNNSVLDPDDITILQDYLNKNIVFNNDQKKKADINSDGNITQKDLDYLKELVENGYILGDINKDNKVNIEDVILVQKYVIKLTNFDDDQFKRADINKDGKVDNDDASLIQAKGLGKN